MQPTELNNNLFDSGDQAFASSEAARQVLCLRSLAFTGGIALALQTQNTKAPASVTIKTREHPDAAEITIATRTLAPDVNTMITGSWGNKVRADKDPCDGGAAQTHIRINLEGEYEVNVYIAGTTGSAMTCRIRGRIQ